jgi:GntR family transcriptional regulator
VQQKIVAALRLEASGVPIYVQLRDQLLRWISTGALKPGDQMPTMRQVAVAVRADLNTVRHAYDELERGGAIVLVRGRGSFVADTVHKSAPPPPDPADTADALARQVLHLAGTAGVDPHHLAERILHLAQAKES